MTLEQLDLFPTGESSPQVGLVKTFRWQAVVKGWLAHVQGCGGKSCGSLMRHIPAGSSERTSLACCQSNAGQDMGAVVGALGELGYGFAYRVLDAQHFGVPQRRRRVFIVGHLGEPWSASAEVLFELEGSGGDSAAGREAAAGVAGGVASGVGVASYTRVGHGGYQPGVGTLQAQGGDCGGGV